MPRRIIRTATTAIAIAALAAPTALARPADMPPAVAKAAAAEQHKQARLAQLQTYPTRPAQGEQANPRPEPTTIAAPNVPAERDTDLDDDRPRYRRRPVRGRRDRRDRPSHPKRARPHHRLVHHPPSTETTMSKIHRLLIGAAVIAVSLAPAASAFALSGRQPQRALAARREAAAPMKPVRRVVVLQRLARRCRRAGDTARAEGLYRRALIVAERYLPADDLTAAPGAQRPGRVAEVHRRLRRSRTALCRRVQGLPRAPRADHPEVATVLHNLGGLAHSVGRPGDGEAAARRAVEIRDAALGPDHPDSAADRAALAAILADLGRDGEARTLLEAALAVFERALGSNHHEVAVTLGSLAALDAKRGDLASVRTATAAGLGDQGANARTRPPRARSDARHPRRRPPPSRRRRRSASAPYTSARALRAPRARAPSAACDTAGESPTRPSRPAAALTTIGSAPTARRRWPRSHRAARPHVQRVPTRRDRRATGPVRDWRAAGPRPPVSPGACRPTLCAARPRPRAARARGRSESSAASAAAASSVSSTTSSAPASWHSSSASSSARAASASSPSNSEATP